MVLCRFTWKACVTSIKILSHELRSNWRRIWIFHLFKIHALSTHYHYYWFWYGVSVRSSHIECLSIWPLTALRPIIWLTTIHIRCMTEKFKKKTTTTNAQRMTPHELQLVVSTLGCQHNQIFICFAFFFTRIRDLLSQWHLIPFHLCLPPDVSHTRWIFFQRFFFHDVSLQCVEREKKK